MFLRDVICALLSHHLSFVERKQPWNLLVIPLGAWHHQLWPSWKLWAHSVAWELFHHLRCQHCLRWGCCCLSLQQGSIWLIISMISMEIQFWLVPFQVTHRAQVEIWRRLTQFLLSLRQQVGFKGSMIVGFKSRDVQEALNTLEHQVMDKLGPVAKSLGLRVPPAAPQGLVGTPLRYFPP